LGLHPLDFYLQNVFIAFPTRMNIDENDDPKIQK